MIRLGHITRPGFFEAATFSGFVLEELCNKIVNTAPALIIEKAVINGKLRKTGRLKYELYVDFLRTLVAKKSFNVRLRLTATMTDKVIVGSTFLGEKEEEIQNQLCFIIDGITENSTVGYKLECSGKIYKYPELTKRVYLKDHFDHAIWRVSHKFAAVERRDSMTAYLKELLEKARINQNTVLSKFGHAIDKEDIGVLLALLHFTRGIPPNTAAVFKYSGQDTIKKAHKAIERKLLKKGVVTVLPGDFAGAATWGFTPELDFKLSPFGVKILQELTKDNHLLAKVLQGRGYDEEQMVK